MPLTIRLVTAEWSIKIVPCLGQSGSAVPSSHRSIAAEKLADNVTFSVHHWDYPGVPASFLDCELDEQFAQEIAFPFSSISRKSPCKLSETTVLEEIVVPALKKIKDFFPELFKVTVEGNFVVHRDEKGDEKDDSTTAPDISAFKGIIRESIWVKDGPLQAFMEGKGPLAASSFELNEGLDGFLNKAVDQHMANDGDEATWKILCQVLEYCFKAKLRVGLLIAPPLLLRPVYLFHEDSKAAAFLGRNCIRPNNDIRSPQAWQAFFGETIWFMFCIWVTLVEEAREKMQDHEKWEEWVPYIERTLRPHQDEISRAAHHRSGFLGTLRPIINLVRHSLLSLSFTVLGPKLPFKFIKSFSTSPLQVSSVITSNDWTHLVHANLPPDTIFSREFAEVYIYRRWGFVVKYASGSGFDAELRAMQGLASLDHCPSVIAHGSTATGLRGSSSPFLVMTYNGEPLPEFDESIVNVLYHDVIKPMHKLGWHHHDIKPDNVVVDVTGKLTLIDFNLAVPREKCTRLMCPDQVFLRRWNLDT